MTKQEFIARMDAALEQHPKYQKFRWAPGMNISATAFALGIDPDQVPKLMRGYRGTRVGNSVLYLKDDVYEAWNERSVMTA